jgi:hypothetical protein
MNRKLNPTERHVMYLLRRPHIRMFQGRPVPLHLTVQFIRGRLNQRQRDGVFYTDQDTRKLLAQMQRKGAPVCTTEYGVKLATNRRDITAQAMRLKRHGLAEIRRAAEILNLRLFDRLAGQIDAHFQRFERLTVQVSGDIVTLPDGSRARVMS